MTLIRKGRIVALLSGLFLAFTLVAIDQAEARRGGSFGSRGTRTFQSAPPTRTAPQPAAPVERSMTPNPGPTAATRQPQAAQQQRPGFMNGFGGSMMRGLLLGGLIGMLMGQGFGGLAGMFGFLLQALLIGGAIWLAIRFFRSQGARGPATAMAGAGANGRAPSNLAYRDAAPREAQPNRQTGATGYGSGMGAAPAVQSKDITLEQGDLDTFQRLLTEVQDAFGREDNADLRRLSTPEMVSFFSEELADNARNGVRNEVSDVSLLQADIAESWREGNQEFATAAMRYESRDVMRDRASGSVVAGTPDELSETVELWTFVRERGREWKLSAIQQAS
jgi:predicted lipid-binding transport protein (Tim44 family)